MKNKWQPRLTWHTFWVLQGGPGKNLWSSTPGWQSPFFQKGVPDSVFYISRGQGIRFTASLRKLWRWKETPTYYWNWVMNSEPGITIGRHSCLWLSLVPAAKNAGKTETKSLKTWSTLKRRLKCRTICLWLEDDDAMPLYAWHWCMQKYNYI